MLRTVCLQYPMEQYIAYDSVADVMSEGHSTGVICHVYDGAGVLDDMEALRLSDLVMELYELEYVTNVSVYWVSSAVIHDGVEVEDWSIVAHLELNGNTHAMQVVNELLTCVGAGYVNTYMDMAIGDMCGSFMHAALMSCKHRLMRSGIALT
jgi:hypothetical protein